MLIFGHPLIDSEVFYSVKSIRDIKSSPSGSIIVIDSMKDSMKSLKFCQKRSVPYAVRVSTIREAIFANALSARYIIVPKRSSKGIMDIAQYYLFDTKVLVEVDREDEIEEMAKVGIDGVILTYGEG
ncbi:MAG: hypothetical protein GXO06_04105 [Epsilonproteobacteria bacterium]|nr:hypothetical protein [Campylobacterota bacterium]